MRAAQGAGARLAALDGLRGLAALAVLSAHTVAHLGLLPWPPLGITGVLVFFVLSGYLIAGVCDRGESTWVGYRAFVRRRVARLGPAAAAVVLVVPTALVLLGGLTIGAALGSAVPAATQTTGFASAFGVWVHPALAPTWSLTTEWVFYLAFPVAVFAARRRGAARPTLARACTVAAVVLYLLALPLPFREYYYLPVANLGVMCAGAALGFAHRAGWRAPAVLTTGSAPSFGLVMLLVFVVLPGGPEGWSYRLVILPVVTIATLAVIHGIHHGRGVERVLSHPALVTPGLRAYSLYLWHMPVLWFAWLFVPGPPWLVALAAMPGVAVVTTVSFHLLERPALRHGAANRARPAVAASAVGGRMSPSR